MVESWECWQTDRRTGRQTHRRMDRQTDRTDSITSTGGKNLCLGYRKQANPGLVMVVAWLRNRYGAETVSTTFFIYFIWCTGCAWLEIFIQAAAHKSGLVSNSIGLEGWGSLLSPFIFFLILRPYTCILRSSDHDDQMNGHDSTTFCPNWLALTSGWQLYVLYHLTPTTRPL